MIHRRVAGSLLAAGLLSTVLATVPAHAETNPPRLPVNAAASDTLHWESLFADWRIRHATHIPNETYEDLYSPEEAEHWLRELALPSCQRVRRNVIDCVAQITVWDRRTGQGETATWTMRTRQFQDRRVRGRTVTFTYPINIRDWSDVPIQKTSTHKSRARKNPVVAPTTA